LDRDMGSGDEDMAESWVRTAGAGVFV
jgi:hypothetical protein